MNYLALLVVGAGLVVSNSDAQAADMPTKAPVAQPAWSWTGWYIGGYAGAALGFSDVPDPYGSSIFGNSVRAPGFLLGAQVGHNWQRPGTHWVFGLEAEGAWLNSEGTSTCFAASGELTSSNCRGRPDFSAAFTGRIGYAAGPTEHTLVYVKAGAALIHDRFDPITNYGFGGLPITATRADPTSWGWTIGAGVEQAVSPAWSVKLEYDYLDFSDVTLSSPATFSTTPGGVVTAVPSNSVGVHQTLHQVKIGLNYRIGTDPKALWPPGADGPFRADAIETSGWSFEPGIRYWYSSGRFQKDLPSDNTSTTSLISRLTYAGLTGNTGELFARLDSPWRVFLKGFIGLGRISGGHMNDEDWGLITAAPFTAYSNTLSDLTATDMNYGTIDLGYDVLQGTGYKVGLFVGYNYIYEQYAANDCTQIASPSAGICTPPIANTAVITETDKWDSLRLGVATDTWLAPQWRLVGDVAYLPYVKFRGVDNHWLRDLVIDEDGHGVGVQIEAILSYYLTPQFSIGAGGRYWAMWTTSGGDAFNGMPIDRIDTYRYERWGLLAQATYRFGER